MPDRFRVNPKYEKTLLAAGIRQASDLFSRGTLVRTVGGKQNLRVELGEGKSAFVGYLKRFSPDEADLGGREFENTLLASSLGIPTPEVIAAGACILGSFFLSAAVQGGTPLDDFLKSSNGDAVGGGPRLRRQLSLEAAEIARRLHEAGRCHRDLYLCHFLVVPDQGHRLVLIDFQRMRRTVPFKTRWLVKDLAALNYSAVPEVCSRTEKLRFLKQYLGLSRLDGRAKKLAAAVMRKTGRMARHEGKKASLGGRSESKVGG